MIGVTPANFFGVEIGRKFDIAVPACMEPVIDGEGSHLAKRNHWWLAIAGRLKPGFSVARAAAQLQAISPQVFAATVPPNYRPDQAKWYAQYKLTALPGGTGFSSLRREYEQPLWLLLAIAGLVLLIACANLANLMLARASAREREIAIRLALGADRGRLIRQLLAETLLLTAIGAGAGVALAQGLSRYLVSFLTTSNNGLFIELAPDWRVLAFTAAVALLTCILFGLTPALRATRTAPAAAMRASGRGLTGDRERFGLRRLLVVTQVALSLVLLVGALLFVRTLRNLLTLDAGLREDGLLVTGIDASRTGFTPARRGVLYRDLLERLRATPGVEDAATARIVQLSGNGWNDMVEIPGMPAQQRMVPWFNRVSPGYFRTMGTPLLAGRDFDERDTTSSPGVAIVNQEFSRKFLGGANPLGKIVRDMPGPGEPRHEYEIVGLVKNSKYQNLRDDFKATVFLAEGQEKEPESGINFIVRSNEPSGALTSAVKKTVMEENGSLSLQFTVFKTEVRESLMRERLMAALSGFFGFLAAVLATVGLYGVISYMFARRRNEIGIRIALGAGRARVIRLVLREAGVLLFAGLVIGAALAVAAARAASSLLFGLQSWDPVTMAAAIALLAAVALAASFFPALHAARLGADDRSARGITARRPMRKAAAAADLAIHYIPEPDYRSKFTPILLVDELVPVSAALSGPLDSQTPRRSWMERGWASRSWPEAALKLYIGLARAWRGIFQRSPTPPDRARPLSTSPCQKQRHDREGTVLKSPGFAQTTRGRARIFVREPAGNFIEFTASAGD